MSKSASTSAHVPVSDDIPAVRFLRFRIDRAARQLERDGQAIELEPKAFDLLDYLIRQPARVVSKAELTDALWPNTVVTASSLTTCVAKVRRALGADADAVLKSYYGKGYRFIAELTADASPVDDAPDALPSSSGWIGRTNERATLDRALQRVSAGHGRVMIVSGDEGMGKSRLLQQVLIDARGEGFQTVMGRCRAESRGAAAQIIEQMIGDRMPVSLSSQWPHELSLAEGRFRVLDQVVSALRRLAETRPLMVLVDDADCADSASILLLQMLAVEVGRWRILLAITCGSGPQRIAWDDALARLLVLPDTEQLTLRRLPNEDALELAHSAAPEPLSERALQTVLAYGQGNPFLIGQLARHASEEAISEEVRRWVERRLDRLSIECRTSLANGATIGTQFDLHALARTIGGSNPQILTATLATLLAHADEAVQAGVLTEVPGSVEAYRFTHAIVRLVLLQQGAGPAADRSPEIVD